MYPADEMFLDEDGYGQPTDDNVRPVADVLVELFARYRSQYPGFELTVIESPSVAT